MKPVLAITMSSMLLFVACKKEIFGKIEVAKEFQIKTRIEKGGLFKKEKYENQAVPVGSWKASLKFEDSTNVWLLIEDGNTKKISPFVLSDELKKAFKSERHDGQYRLQSQYSGQTVDAVVNVNTTVTQGEPHQRDETCYRDVPESIQVCTRDSKTGRVLECHYETRMVSVSGLQHVEFHMRNVQKDIAVELQDSLNGEVLAKLPVVDYEQSEVTDYRSECFLHPRPFGFR
jgi:hypothetical protein